MNNYVKPQSPLYSKENDAYFYPLTTIDQILMEDGSRLSSRFTEPKAGFIYPLASANVPEGFLLCDGAEYSRTKYVELFAAIGTIYGEGDGSTTFNVPNLQTRVPIGASEKYTLGSTGGEETHILTTDEMTSTQIHVAVQDTSQSNTEYRDAVPMTWTQQWRNSDWVTQNADSGSAFGNSQPHNNMQPYTVVNYIIATGKHTGVSVQDVIKGIQALPLGVEHGGTGATNIEDARNNLGIDLNKLKNITKVLLWENASPRSSFDTQTINLDLEPYDAVYINCRFGADPGYETYYDGHPETFSLIFVGHYGTLVNYYNSLDGAGETYRNCYVDTDNIHFYAGHSITNRNMDGTYAIPQQIYGIKF